MVIKNIGNNIDEWIGSSPFQQDIDALVDNTNDTIWGKISSAFDTIKSLWWVIKDQYNIYTADDIKSWWSFKDLRTTITERANEQYNVASNQLLSKEEKDIQYSKINDKYKWLESELLNKAIKWDTVAEQYEKFYAMTEKLSNQDIELDDKQKMLQRVATEIETNLNRLDKPSTSWLVDNDVLSFKLWLKQSLAEKTSTLYVSQRELVAELTRNNAKADDINKAKSDYDRAIALQELINKYSLDAANEWIVSWDELTDYVTSKLWPTLTKEAVDIDNNLARRAQEANYKSNLDAGNYFTWGIMAIGSWLSYIAWKGKEAINFNTSDVKRFKKDFNELQLQDKNWLDYMVWWTLNNLDDIVTEWVVAAIWWGGAVSASKYTTSQIAKATRLSTLLETTAAWQAIKNSKISKWIDYLTKEWVAWLVANQSLNIAAWEINSPDRMVLDAMMDLAMAPLFDWALNRIWWAWRTIQKWVESSALWKLMTTEKDIVDELVMTWVKTDQANDMVWALKTYMSLTNTWNSNSDIINFIKTNSQKLKEEWTIIWEWKVFSVRDYISKAENPFNVDVTEAKALLDSWININLKDNSLTAIDLNNTFKKISTIDIKQTPNKTVESLLKLSWSISKKDIELFINDPKNVKLIEWIHNTALAAKNKIQTSKISWVVNNQNNPISEITELNNTYSILTDKLSTAQQVVSVFMPEIDELWNTRFINRIVKTSDLTIDWYTILTNYKWQERQAFLNNTILDKLDHKVYDSNPLTVALIKRWDLDIASVQDKQVIIDDLSMIFWTNDIKTDWTWIINLIEKDNKLLISIWSNTWTHWNISWLITDKDITLKYRTKDYKLKMDKDTVLYWQVNKILLRKLLARTDKYTPWEFEDILESHILNLAHDISLWQITNQYISKDIDSIASIAKSNTNKLLKWTFTDSELKQFNEMLNETLFTKSALHKLSIASWMWSKEHWLALWTLIEWLTLKAAERFKQLESKKVLFDINNSKLLTWANKKDAIINLLLWKDPINAFKYVWAKWSWQITDWLQKLLWVKHTDKIFTVSKEQLDRFKEALINNKKDLWLTTDAELELFKKNLDVVSDWYIDKAVSVYTDRVIRTALNTDSIDNIVREIKVSTNKDIDTSWIRQLEDLIIAQPNIESLIIEANQIIPLIPKELPKIELDRLLNVIDFIQNKVDQSKWKTPTEFVDLIKWVDKISEVITRTFDLEKEYGNTYAYDSQVYWWDNIFKKSLNYILNPYQESQIFDIKIAKAIDWFITEKILTPNGYKGKSLLSLWELAKATDWDAQTYNNAVEKANDIIRTFLYSENIDSFNSKKAIEATKGRDKILDEMLVFIRKEIENYDWLTVLNKNNKPASKKERADIILQEIDRWSIINTLQNRLTKRHFDWHKIDFNTNTYSKIEWIEEYRTMFTHLYNAWWAKWNYKPLILEWNELGKFSFYWWREWYRLANNFAQYARFNKSKAFTVNEQWYVTFTKAFAQEFNKFFTDEWFKNKIKSLEFLAKKLLRDENAVPWYINLMNIWDKNSFWAYTVSYKKDSIKNFADFIKVNDDQFTKDLYKELNFKDDKWKPLSLSKAAKRLATITAEEESLLPWSKIKIRNYIFEEPQYIDAILNIPDRNTDSLTRDDLFIYWTKVENKIEVQDKDKIIWLTDIGKEFLLKNFKNELGWYKKNFQYTDFDTFEEWIIDFLQTAYSDWVSFLHPEQIKFYSRFQSHIGKTKDDKWNYHSVRSPIKMHHYWQSLAMSILFKTNFNSYTDDMLKQIESLIWDSFDVNSTRFIWEKSTKLENYEWKFVKLEEDKYIEINWVKHKIKWYVETDSSMDRHASSEAEVHEEVNWITKQWDVRTHPVASEFILRVKQDLITESINELKNTFNIDWKMDATIFNEYEQFSRYVLNDLWLKWDTLSSVNQYLNDKLKSLKELIEKPKDAWLWFRTIMQPRIFAKSQDWSLKFIRDDEMYVSKERFEDMKDKMLNVWWEYFVMTYRNPVPNAENMTMKKVLVDYSMVSMEDSAISSWDAFVNKQADFDWDHLNIVYINNQLHKWNQLWGLWISLWYILNLEEAAWNTDLVQSIARIVYSKDWIEAKDDVFNFVKEWISSNKDEWLLQTRVPVQQVNKDWWGITDQVMTKKVKWTITEASSNAITGKDNISVVDSFIRTIDLIRKYWWEYNNAEAIWRTQDQIADDLRDTLLFNVKKWEKDLEQLSKAPNPSEVPIAELKELISNEEELIEQVVQSISYTVKNPSYKSIAAWLEQMTLDLASVWADKMPDNWEFDVLQSVFPTLWADELKLLFDPIWANTWKVYKLLWESKTMDYGIAYSDKLQEYTNIELPLLWQHKALYIRLSDEIKSIRENLSTISNIKADKKFFWITEWDINTIFNSVLSKYDTNIWLQELLANPNKSYTWFVKKKWEENIPWLDIRSNKVKVIDKDLFSQYMKWRELYELDNVWLKSDEVYSLLKNNKTFFKKDPKNKYIDFKYINTKDKAKWWYGKLIYEHSKEFIDKISSEDYLNITWRDKQAILLKMNLPIDRSELSPAQRIRLTFWHYIMKSPELKNKDLLPHEELALLEEWASKLFKDVSESQAITEDIKNEIAKISWELDIPLVNVEFNKWTYTVYTDKDLSYTMNIWWETYIVDKNGKWEYVFSTELDKPLPKVGSDVAKVVLKDLQTTPIKREFDLEKHTWMDSLRFQKVAEEADKFINDMWNYQTLLMWAKAIKPFKKLLLRNQELKNQASYDLYEWFADLQRAYMTLDKVKLRQIDNVLFMKIYKWNDDPSVRIYDDFIRSFSDQEKKYYSEMSAYVLWNNPKKQSINDLFGKLNIDLSALLADGKPIYTKIRSSLIEDIVNLRHKTEKIAFYEAWIYNKKTFLANYKKNMEDQSLPYNEKEATQLFQVIFEYDVLSKWLMWKTLSTMRSTSYATTLWVMSWLSWMAWLTMWLMQIPSELVRLWSLSRHSFKPEDLNSLMDKHSILKSTWIQAWVYFWPIEVKPPMVQQYAYKVLSKLQWAVWMSDSELTETIKRYTSAFANNPLLITDIVVDKWRKQVALWNVINMLWFKTPESFSSHLSTLSKEDANSLLNKVRLASEMKYHELSWWVTAWSYLWRETTFARKWIMLPFNYLMNWSQHVMSSAIWDARQTLDWFANIFKWNISEWTRLIKQSNLLSKTVWQSIIAGWLYAKINSYEDYEWQEFSTKKDMLEFIKTVNANIVATEMFMPVKAIQWMIEAEGWLASRIASWFTAVWRSMFREADLPWIIADEAWSAYQTPWYWFAEALTTAIVNKWSAWLAFNKMIEVESSYPEFTRRAMIDQMFGSNNPNFDESLYNNLYWISKWERLDALYKSWNVHLILWEVMKSIPIIRHLSNLSDWWISYSLFDKQVREINKQLSDKSFDIYYNNPDLMLIKWYETWTNKLIWDYMTWYATSYWTIDYKDKSKVSTELSRLIPTMDPWLYQQLTENIMVGEIVKDKWVQWYIDAISKWKTESQQYQLQLAEKLKTESPAKLPYVLSILLNNDFYEAEKALKKSWIFLSTADEDLLKSQLLMKYSPLIKDNVPLMSQLLWYQVAEERPELKDILISKSWFIQNHVADRIAAKVMVTEAYNKWNNAAYLIWTRLWTITNKLRSQFEDWSITESIYKTALLDIYREADDAVYNSNFNSNQKLEIKTTLYKALWKDAYILHEDPKLWLAYEWARVNMAHKLYKHTSLLESYMKDATLASETWQELSWAKPSDWSYWWSSYAKAYKQSYTSRPYSWWNYNPWFVKDAANNIQWMLWNPRTNFAKSFNPKMNPYPTTTPTPFGFRFTVNDAKTAIDYFRIIMSDQYSRDLIVTRSWKAIKTRLTKRRSESIAPEQKIIWRQEFRRQMSRWLLRGLPGGED